MSDMDEPLSSDDSSRSTGKVKSISSSSASEDEEDDGEESGNREINQNAESFAQASVQSISDVLGIIDSFAVSMKEVK